MLFRSKSTEQVGVLDEFEMMELESGGVKQFELYDNIGEFIHNYEESQKKKKEDKKVVKKPKGLENFLED